MEDITNDVEKNAVVMDDPELNGLRRVAEEMAEMNNIIEKLNEQATNLNKLTTFSGVPVNFFLNDSS